MLARSWFSLFSSACFFSSNMLVPHFEMNEWLLLEFFLSVFSFSFSLWLLPNSLSSL